MRGIILIVLVLIVSIVPVYSGGQHLTLQELNRVKECKRLLREVDQKSLDQVISGLENSQDPQSNLMIMEAMAKTYIELVDEQNVTERSQKEWLYSMVNLNMAYLQFGGVRESEGRSESLNQLIRKKLREHIPKQLFDQKDVFFSLED